MEEIWKERILLLLVSIILQANAISDSKDPLSGPNVCRKQIVVKSNIQNTKHVPQGVETIKNIFCKFGPNCSVKAVTFKKQTETTKEERNQTIYTCCEGYVETPERTCKPYCAENCVHGNCSEPNKCECDPGYMGPTCGEECKKGWIGEKCDKPCPNNYFGEKCAQPCSCQNQALCDHVSGKCTCLPGFEGTLCDQRSVSEECHCENGGKCDFTTQACSCPPGWMV